MKTANHLSLLTIICFYVFTSAIHAQTLLPRDHAYQHTLVDYLATLEASDFEHGVAEPFAVVVPEDDDTLYRLWLLSLDVQPVIGSKRGYPSLTAPGRLFTLDAVQGDEAVMVPPVWPQPLAWVATWDYPGNPYRAEQAARALKLRCFVHVAVSMMMLDHQLETDPHAGGNRPDWFAPQLMRFAYVWPRIRDALPQPVQKAYETGLRKMAQRQLDWGVKGEEINQDMVNTVGLLLAIKALDDPDFAAAAKQRIEMLLTDPKYFHPSGYFVDRGGPEVGFGGMAGFNAIWVAMASDWDFADRAVNQWYHLRSHLVLPEPDGTLTGPTHFNTRLGQPAFPGQWDWGFRDVGGALVTDHAAWLAPLPDREKMIAGLTNRIDRFNHMVKENPRVRDENGKLRYLANEELESNPWKFAMWPSWNYPITTSFVYDHYPKGGYARLLKLKEEKSGAFESPYLTSERFRHEFDDAFIAIRQPTYAAILHTGPVGRDTPDTGLFHFAGPHGLGGGQLSAFWTPDTGSVILGRRAGMNWDKSLDQIEQWRLWPIHAVSGAKADGKMFTSARIADPIVTQSTDGDAASVQVAGDIPREILGQGKVLEGRLVYARQFVTHDDRVQITTTVTSTGQDVLAELYETIPVYLRDAKAQKQAKPSAIYFQIDDNWQPADANWHEKVTAIRIDRFAGSVQIAFDQPQRVRLSDADWQDTYVTRAMCRNVLVDLLAHDPQLVFRKASLRYTISAAN